DRFHHALEDRVEETPRFLGIAIGQQLHRALQVGKEDGHLLALTFQSASRADDLLGQVLRRVGLRRLKLRPGGGCGGGGEGDKGRAAAAAELLAAFVQEATRRTRRVERPATLATEAATLAILGPALRAPHVSSSYATALRVQLDRPTDRLPRRVAPLHVLGVESGF